MQGEIAHTPQPSQLLTCLVTLFCGVWSADAQPPKKQKPAVAELAPPGGVVTPLPRWPRAADPKPLLTAHFLDLTIVREKGRLRIQKLVKGAFPKAQVVAPRFRGRFEVRLFDAAGQLRDVVRFDFPLTGASTERSDKLGALLASGVTARLVVRLPFDESISAATIYDTVARAAVKVDLSSVVTRRQPRIAPRALLRTRSFIGPQR